MIEQFKPKQFDSFNKVPEDQKYKFKEKDGSFVYKQAFWLSKKEAEEEAELERYDLKAAERLIKINEIEKKLSPEIIELIMNKIQDIDQGELAYHVLTERENPKERNSIINIEKKLAGSLKNGLLSISNGVLGGKEGQDVLNTILPNRKDSPLPEEIKDLPLEQKWVHNVRKNKTGLVFFNLTGGWHKNQPHAIEIRESWYVQYQKSVVLLFELKEKDKKIIAMERNSLYPGSSRGTLHEEIGFALPYRVAPRRFNGIVINNCNDERLIPMVKGNMLEIYKDKPELMLPIYNMDGDLLWPKQMPYKEIKKLVEGKTKIAPNNILPSAK